MPGIKKSRLFEKYVKVVETGKPLNTEILYDFEGINSWFEISAVKMEDGIVITFSDINSKKITADKLLVAYEEVKIAKENLRKFNAELEKIVEECTRELSASEERFRLISRATNDAVWDWTFIDNKLWWNEGFKTIFQYTQDQIEPGIESWYSRIHPDDKDRVISGINQAINAGESQWSDEYQFMKADGTYAYVFNRGYIIHNENNMPYRMLGSLIDLTKLKKAQEDLQETNKHLTKINADLDNFIYTASHDLKAPINNIEGLMINLEKMLHSDNKHVSLIIEHIKKSIDRFKITIKDLTEISKIQKNLDTEVTQISFEDIMEDVQLGISDLINQNNANIIKDFSNITEVRYSRKNLNSILYNLASNAIKYCSPDRQPEIRISTYRDGSDIVLQVSDNGLGIKESQKDKLFTMFKRLHTHVEGTGVGLYIVKRIVDNNGGRIEVESTLNEGSTFKVYFTNQFSEVVN
jgi:two-component system CheB/CheR fusion protein